MKAAVIEWGPYLILILVGFLPNEVWRVVGLLTARRLDEDSELVIWSRTVATALLAGVIAKLILFSSGELANIPLSHRCSSVRPWYLFRGEALGICRCHRGRNRTVAWRILFRALAADCRRERFGMFGQHVRLFLFAGRGLHGHAGLARDNVEVQVEHHLAAGALIELLDSDAVG